MVFIVLSRFVNILDALDLNGKNNDSKWGIESAPLAPHGNSAREHPQMRNRLGPTSDVSSQALEHRLMLRRETITKLDATPKQGLLQAISRSYVQVLQASVHICPCLPSITQ